MKTKVVLISPKGPLYRHRKGIFKRSLRYAPLTLTTLASLIPDDMDIDLQIIDEGIQDVNPDIKADLIGMTVITGCANRAYELSKQFRRNGSTVVLGGPHVTLIPEESQAHADSIVTGYAEDTWPELLKDFVAGKLKPRYDQAKDLDLANRPFPKRSMLPQNKFITSNVFEATRGCVHNCDFCVVPSAWGRKPYQKPVSDVVADIKQHGAKKLIFIDLNIIADRTYASSLFEALIPLKVKWYGLATTHLVDEAELLKLAARSGCKGLLMGLESISDANLRESGKKFNSPEKYKELVSVLHQHGISLQGCFVFGMDHDDPDIFMKTAKFTVDAKIDLPRFAIATPFPGTALYKRLSSEDRIFTRNWDLYDGQHVVFKPRNMSVDQLLEGTRSAWKYAYSISSTLKRIRGLPSALPVNVIANLGYRYYSKHLDDTYNCDWIIGTDGSEKFPLKESVA